MQRQRPAVSTAGFGASNTDSLLWSLRRHLGPLTATGTGPLNLSLQISAGVAKELAEGRLDELRDVLSRHSLRVTALEGELYGDPLQSRIKEAYFMPDWGYAERVRYTQTLMNLLAALLPKGGEGVVTTIPLSFRGFAFQEPPEAHVYALALLAAHSQRLEKWSGRRVRLALRPQTRALLESPGDMRRFLRTLSQRGGRMLADELSINPLRAAYIMRDRIRPALDLGHVLARFDNADRWMAAFDEAGFEPGAILTSNLIRTVLPADPIVRRSILSALMEAGRTPYFAMVTEMTADGRLVCHGDVAETGDTILRTNGIEWRLGLKLPFGLSHMGILGSTLQTTASLLNEAAESGAPVILEPGACDRLPEAYRQTSGDAARDAIAWYDASQGRKRRSAA